MKYLHDATLAGLQPNTVFLFVHLLNQALDEGQDRGLGVQEVAGHIQAGDLMDFLSRRLGLGLGLIDEAQAGVLVAALQKLLAKGAESHAGHPTVHTAWGVHRRGLCLLLAWGLELMREISLAMPLPPKPGLASSGFGP